MFMLIQKVFQLIEKTLLSILLEALTIDLWFQQNKEKKQVLLQEFTMYAFTEIIQAAID